MELWLRLLFRVRFGSSSGPTGCGQNLLLCGSSSEAPTFLLGTCHEALQGWGSPHHTALEGELLQGSPTCLKASPDLVRPTQVNLLLVIESAV